MQDKTDDGGDEHGVEEVEFLAKDGGNGFVIAQVVVVQGCDSVAEGHARYDGDDGAWSRGTFPEHAEEECDDDTTDKFTLMVGDVQEEAGGGIRVHGENGNDGGEGDEEGDADSTDEDELLFGGGLVDVFFVDIESEDGGGGVHHGVDGGEDGADHSGGDESDETETNGGDEVCEKFGEDGVLGYDLGFLFVEVPCGDACADGEEGDEEFE